jgi:hypothetical protein
MIYLMFGFALALSTVAAFYAIFGLVAIFAAAPVAIIILGSLLEGSKLVIASWLYRNWKQIPILMKSYFLVALIIIMGLTSMGIFGFLSRAHIEQTAVGTESQAQIERMTKEISRQNALVERAESRFNQLQTSGVGADSNVQSQINTEQGRIDSAYQRVQPAIDEQQAIIDAQTKLFQDELARIDQQLSTLQQHVDSGDIAKAQGMIGTKADGQYGPATARAFTQWQSKKQQERRDVINKIESANSNPTVKAARDEIQRLRSQVETQIAESNKLINRLRSQLGSSSAADVEAALSEQQGIIKTANAEIDTLTQQKYQLESEVRKLEVEVGPIKYVADMVYGDQPDANTLEKAVRIMILLLVSVFDPLAVLMLIAANWTLMQSHPKDLPPNSSRTVQRDPEPEEEDSTDQVESEPPTTKEHVDDIPQPSESLLKKIVDKLPKRTLGSVYVPEGDHWISRPHDSAEK